MASTAQLLTWIEEQSHGWDRWGPRGSCALFNEAHKMLLYDEAEQNVVYDPATGDLPFIITQAGVYRYNCPLDCWLPKAMLIDLDETPNAPPWRYEDYEIGGMAYRRVLNIRTRESRRNTLATVQFAGVDPGATTSLYRLLYYLIPVEILSDAIQHQMPGTTDMELLVPATIKLIEGIDHGDLIEAREYIMQEMKPQLQHAMDRGEQGLSNFRVKRAF